jgi:hypothetical protein
MNENINPKICHITNTSKIDEIDKKKSADNPDLIAKFNELIDDDVSQLTLPLGYPSIHE